MKTDLNDSLDNANDFTHIYQTCQVSLKIHKSFALFDGYQQSNPLLPTSLVDSLEHLSNQKMIILFRFFSTGLLL